MTNSPDNGGEGDQTALVEFAPTEEFARAEVGRLVCRPSERPDLYDVVFQQWNRSAESSEWEDEMHLGWVTEEQRDDASIRDGEA